MAEIGRYQKAYYVKDFRALPGWEENLDNLSPEIREEKNGDVEVPRTELGDDDVLYLQDNYVVTDGIYKDENIVFDKVTDEWKAACHSQLPTGFEIPDFGLAESQSAENDTQEETTG